MKKKILISLFTVPLVAATVFGYIYKSELNVISAQNQIVIASDKATQGKIEYIKETFSDGAYIVRIRDKENLTEITEEYRNNKLHNKLIIEDGGKRITSYGRDFETNKLVGNTWTMPENIAAENKKLLQISLLEKAKEELQSQSWTILESSTSLTAAASNQQQVVTEDEFHKEIVTIDNNTGLPIKREIFLKDKNGNIVYSSTKTEEYKYLDTMPLKVQNLSHEEDVEIKEIPAPIIEDKVFEGS
ncbi:hypothetical protein [Paenibacillus lentus]|uniref:MucB/RseB N-terminal domain-containing protein n=1 Tax=Paenibacillus lentus TaxID=1338368 RepID=A0A3Q8S5I0_9BACL|nr:hypothetical protein [Paenibacillus lentus]AZK47468.1 hypothetical protein EIM92_15985 [Paenibacillus lentus]